MARDSDLTFTGHLEDLRRCLLKSLGAVALAFVVSFYFSNRIFAFMVAPLNRALQPGESLIGTGVAEAFFVEMKVGLAAGIFFASPFIFYQIWRFIAPGLHESEKKLAIPFVLCASLFFIGGAYFCYRVVLPFAFTYFVDQYRTLGVSPEIRIGDYFTFFFRMVLAFGMVFEMPVFTFFFVRLGILNYRMMWRGFRYAIVVIFVVAAILTPTPDVINQSLMAVPMTLLYLLSIGVAYVWRRRD
ncbi:MAG: twin-arginine translocase subunit TatC [Deltaproteobacteria bacterium]|nr:twin-arginine translocase subunit TatC [Deltaproteobacteria bacterium]